jgi:hypothetical protein
MPARIAMISDGMSSGSGGGWAVAATASVVATTGVHEEPLAHSVQEEGEPRPAGARQRLCAEILVGGPKGIGVVVASRGTQECFFRSSWRWILRGWT